MPCNECHVAHGRPTTSIYMFSETRVGAPITSVRQLCVGCHRPYDSTEETPVVCGLPLLRLPSDPDEHGLVSTVECSTCHGATGHSPQGHGDDNCGDPACHGATGSHAIHLNSADPRGPGLLHCSDCHAAGDIPYFGNGTDSDSSGHIELDEAADCDTCHSPGGDYDGMDPGLAPSGAMSVGARENWESGVYETTSTLQAGKERWCAGCHDGEPSVVEGVAAPNVIGDEDLNASYGVGVGFYATGHGLDSGFYPATGAPAADTECDACHAYEWTHIDGNARTYVRRASYAGFENERYQDAYRLKGSGGGEPMDIPRTDGGMPESDFALCL
ncbi:MAG: hypothetical protein OEV43_04900, partial [Coriobacteriia bacterium]|nr:hypothetical protein [Coriobacteriia bacterium]